MESESRWSTIKDLLKTKDTLLIYDHRVNCRSVLMIDFQATNFIWLTVERLQASRPTFNEQLGTEIHNTATLVRYAKYFITPTDITRNTRR